MRFSGGADTTVKLYQDTVYTFQLTSNPGVAFMCGPWGSGGRGRGNRAALCVA